MSCFNNIYNYNQINEIIAIGLNSVGTLLHAVQKAWNYKQHTVFNSR